MFFGRPQYVTLCRDKNVDQSCLKFIIGWKFASPTLKCCVQPFCTFRVAKWNSDTISNNTYVWNVLYAYGIYENGKAHRFLFVGNIDKPRTVLQH